MTTIRPVALPLTEAAKRWWLLIAIGLLLGLPTAASAAPGELDSDFGTGGIATSDVGDAEGNDVAIQPDGKLVVVGKTGGCTGSGEDFGCHSEFLVQRYLSNGSLDTSFGGGDGIVTTDFGNETQEADAVAIDSSGRLLVGGTTYDAMDETPGFALARYNADGSPDTSFGGGDGEVTAGLSDVEGIQVWSGSMRLLPNEKVVIAGAAYVLDGFGTWHFSLVRFNADGSLDSSFGTGGTEIGPPGHPYGLAEDSDGRLLAAGRAGSSEFAVLRFQADGDLDASFAGDGIATLDLSPSGSQADDVAVQPDGKIVASGFGSGLGFAVARFTPSGAPDPEFGGGDGFTLTEFSQPCCGIGAAISVALQPDGRIVFAGQWNPDEDSLDMEWAVGRLYSNGAPDRGFGTGGLTTTDVAGGGYLNYARSVLIQGDGKIVAVGGTGATSHDLAMARYEGGLGPPQPLHHNLRIEKAGSGEGIVNGRELYCGSNCAAAYPFSDTVEVRAFPELGSTFTGWSTISGDPGTCTGTTTPCQVPLDGHVELIATFGDGPAPIQRQTLVRTQGAGSGTVTSSPAGISCGTTCSGFFDDGTVVTFTATAAAGSHFAGWTVTPADANCEGDTDPCEIELTQDVEVSALFLANNNEGGASPTQTAPPSTPSPPVVSVPSGPVQGAVRKKPAARKRALKRCRKLDGKAKRRCVRKAKGGPKRRRESGLLMLATELRASCIQTGLAPPRVLEAWVRHPGDRKTQSIFVEADWRPLPDDCEGRFVRKPLVRFHLQNPTNHARWINVGAFVAPERRSWKVKEELEAERESEDRSCWEMTDAGKTFVCDLDLRVTNKGGDGTAYAPQSPAWPDPDPQRERYRYRCTPGPGVTQARALIRHIVRNQSTGKIAAERVHPVPVKVKSYQGPPHPGHPKRGALEGPC